MSVGEFDSLLSQTGALDPDEAIASISIEGMEARRAQRQKQRLDDEQRERDDRAGEPDDVVAEREAIREKEDAREAGDKDTGGGSGSASPVQPSAVSGPEPRPQHEELDGSDEPDDDGEEDTEEPDAEPELVEETPAVREPEPEPEPEPESVSASAPAPEQDAIPREPRKGAKPASWKEGEKFSYGIGPVDDQGKSTEMKLSRFPKSLVAALRLMVGAHLGDAFAKEASGNQLATAFIAARLGVSTDADENTSRLITAFRELEPQMDELSRSIASMEKQMASLAQSNRGLVKRISAVEDITASAELATSFFIADRIGMISTSEMTIEKAEISQPKALAMRDKIREQAKAEQDRQRRDEGTSY